MRRAFVPVFALPIAVTLTVFLARDRAPSSSAPRLIAESGFAAAIEGREPLHVVDRGWAGLHGVAVLPRGLDEPVTVHAFGRALTVRLDGAGAGHASGGLVEYGEGSSAWQTVLAARVDGFEDFRVARAPVGASRFTYRIAGLAAPKVTVDRDAVRIASEGAGTFEIERPRARDVAGHEATLDVVATMDHGEVAVEATFDPHGMTFPVVVDPAFVVRPAMHLARRYHTATKLSDGRVLVAGGSTTDSTIEVYDPKQDSWTVVGTLSEPRETQMAVAFGGGTKVFLGGGTNTPGVGLSTADVYDDATHTVTKTAGDMKHRRAYPFGGVLPDGTILVAGGYENGTISAVEIFDPTNGTFSAGVDLPVPRLAAQVQTLSDGTLVAIGGREVVNASTRVDRFDPAAKAWTSLAPTLAAGDLVVTKLQDGRIFAVSGSGATGASYSSAEVYDATANTWTAVASMHEIRFQPTINTMSDGKVLVVGGAVGAGSMPVVLSSAELYDPTANTWTETSPMRDTRVNFASATLDDGRVLVMGGGTDDPTTLLSSAESYGVATDGAGCKTGGECVSGYCDPTGHCAEAPPDAGADTGNDAATDAGDAGSDAVADAGDAATDSGSNDAALDAADAADGADGGTTIVEVDGSGCSCRTNARRTGGAASASFGAAFVALVLSRRRRRS